MCTGHQSILYGSEQSRQPRTGGRHIPNNTVLGEMADLSFDRGLPFRIGDVPARSVRRSV